jgi:hypothetical protein
MKVEKKVRIGCASAFWGDTSTAAKQLVEKGEVDYLVFDFLAEVTMSILAGAKLKNPDMGYATDFVKQVSPLLKDIKEKKITVISNAGGLNPNACRSILAREAEKLGINLKIAVISGDDLSDRNQEFKDQGIREVESNETIPDHCLSINAYLGAPGIVSALDKKADIVITGRCVDSAMVLAPLMYEFKWKSDNHDLMASGSLAGHIIECGAQCTGGNYTDWQQVNGFDDMGFPIVEVSENGEFIVSKPRDTGGLVTVGTVAEQFLYEIGNPSEYFLPDVVCDFTNVSIQSLGNEKVLVKGARGYPATDTYKVSLTHMNGFRVTGTLVIGGMRSKLKGEIIANAIFKKTRRILKDNNLDDFSETSFDLIGADSIYGPENMAKDSRELVLRVLARHPKKEALILFSREIAQAATGMASGVINYLGGRPTVSPSIHLFSFLVPKDQVAIEVDIDKNKFNVGIDNDGGYKGPGIIEKSNIKVINIDSSKSVPLIKLAFARSGDKGDHANIGVVARSPEFLPYIKNALTKDAVAQYFKHVLKGSIECWDVPGVNGLNFLLKNSLGGGGMASLNIDPQGKGYAQQLLEYKVPVSEKIFHQVC